jgi:hypothetical protein
MQAKLFLFSGTILHLRVRHIASPVTILHLRLRHIASPVTILHLWVRHIASPVTILHLRVRYITSPGTTYCISGYDICPMLSTYVPCYTTYVPRYVPCYRICHLQPKCYPLFPLVVRLILPEIFPSIAVLMEHKLPLMAEESPSTVYFKAHVPK